MRISLHPIFAGATGVALYVGLWQLAVYSRPLTYQSSPWHWVRWLLFEGPILQAALYLIPWLVVGAISKRSPILTASIAGFVAETARHALFFHSTLDGMDILGSVLRFGTAGAIYGAAAGALGAHVAAANNSFKPNPHRGGA